MRQRTWKQSLVAAALLSIQLFGVVPARAADEKPAAFTDNVFDVKALTATPLNPKILKTTEADGIVDPATLPFLRDCLDHTAQVLDVAETFRDVAGDMRDLYFTQISLRTNDVMKLLTIISTIFMPLSFIAGVYGMNFNAEVSRFNMPETQWYLGYPFVLAVMATTASVMLGYFHRKGWLFGQ